MFTADFISVEDDGTDLILSFAVADEQGVAGIRSLILLRTPEFERLLPEDERGVTVLMEDDGDEGMLLTRFEFTAEGPSVAVHTKARSYQVALSAVDSEELEEMRSVIQKMNFDSCFKITGI